MITLAVVLAFAASILGQVEGNPENYCRNGLFAAEKGPFRIAEVQSGTNRNNKAYIYSDVGNCPTGNNCRSRWSVVSGAEVLVSRVWRGFACTMVEGKSRSQLVGWIEASRLKFRTEDVSAGSWVGNWTYYDNSIEIKAGTKTGEFVVKGTAIWKGLGDNVHVGELDGMANVSDTELLYGSEDPPEDCRVRFRTAGDYLIVSDNMNCGGANVTFTGVYRRSTNIRK